MSYLKSVESNIQESIDAKKLLLERCSKDIDAAACKIIESLRSGGKIMFCGNGGSAADAQHIAAEFVGRYVRDRKALAAIALTTDTSILTAVANDYGYDNVFSRQVQALAKPQDILIGIPTSGNSPSIIKAFELAKQMNIFCIGLSGRDGGSMKSYANINIVVPSQKTSRIQECHILIGHVLCECVDVSDVAN